MVLSWKDQPGLRLEMTRSLAQPEWMDVDGSDGQGEVELQMTDASGFFRLHSP